MLLNLKLDTLRSFLERVGKSVDQDYLDVSKRENAGEFEDNDEIQNALYDPMQAEKIAIRAVYYELNALIESELQHLAVDPQAREEKEKGREVPRPFLDIPIGDWWKLIKSSRLVWDLRGRNRLCKIIESYYQVQLDDLPGSGEVDRIREIVNAYKHREGVHDPRKEIEEEPRFPRWYELGREQAFQAINSAGDFFIALWSEIDARSND